MVTSLGQGRDRKPDGAVVTCMSQVAFEHPIIFWTPRRERPAVRCRLAESGHVVRADGCDYHQGGSIPAACA